MLIPLLIIIAILIIIEDGFPFLYKQERIGKDCTHFTIYKFRSMKSNTPNVASHLLVEPHKHILRTGSFLRKYSLDELPNLWNIIKGEMVFVGPRPALFNQYDLIEMRMGTGVYKLKPGLTGWAQVNGRDEISLEEKVSLERVYLERKSILFDLKIIGRTLYKIVIISDISH